MLDRVFGNRYKLVEKIGIGGMAEVYKSTDDVLGRTVAVKVMLPQYAADPTFAARFKQEAQSAANLQSPYIVNIYDWGQDSADGTYYIVMEYVRGTDLKTAIQQRGAINQRKAAEIGSQICSALSVAHGYDIIHRDIKPHNIMVQPDGNTKVMDFGIARASGSSMTQTGSVLGTAYYISPEQAQGKPLTAATDLYSLGVVLYETVTGQVPFDAPDAVAVALKQVKELPIPPSQINPNIDPELEAGIMRALEKDPMDRYTTAEQMRVALNNYLAGRPVDTNVDAPAAKTRVMGAAAALPVINARSDQMPDHTSVMPTSVAPMSRPTNMRSSNRAKEEAQRNKRKNMIIIAAIASVLCLLVVAGVVYALLNNAPTKVEVPDVVGKTEIDAKADLEAAKLKAGTSKFEASTTVEKDRVISTNPSAKTMVNEGSAVDMVISSGPEPPKKVKVPNLRDKTTSEARSMLAELGLKLERGSDRFDANIAHDKVCAQDPPADTEVDEGSTVLIYCSKGKETSVVPNVADAGAMSEADAKAAIEAAGLVCAVGEPEYSDDVAKGNVISQDPKAAEPVDSGSTVTIIISLGPEPITVPEVTGKPEADAKAAIEAAGLVCAIGEPEYSDDVAKGNVISQDPVAKKAVDSGSTVTIIISLGPETKSIDVPDVTGMTKDAATKALTNAGFKVSEGTSKNSDTVPKGRVISYSPTKPAREGTTIELVISLGPKT